MSKHYKDVVRFTVPDRRIYGCGGKTRDYRELLKRIFSLEEHEIAKNSGKDLVLICRPSQFARFLIFRDQAGLQNNFQELNASLITREPVNVFDVSGRWTNREKDEDCD